MVILRSFPRNCRGAIATRWVHDVEVGVGDARKAAGLLSGVCYSLRFPSVPAGTPKGFKLSSRGQGHGLCARRPRMAPPLISSTPKGSNCSAPLEPVPPLRRAVEPFTQPDAQPQILPINPAGSEPSRPIESRDPTQILRSFRTIYIISRTVWLSLDLMQEALQRKPELQAWGVAIVSDPRVADVRLTVNRVLFTWTWTYEMVHQNTGIVLGAGKFNATAGGGGASKIAEVVQRISQARGMPAGVAAPKKP